MGAEPISAPVLAEKRLRFGASSKATLLGVLVAMAAVPYLGILSNAFVYDDNTQVLNNPYIQNIRHLHEIFTTTVWSYVGAQGVTNYYRPMMTFGYLLCYQIFGPLAFGFHLASLLLHVGVVCLVFLVALRMMDNRLTAFIAASLFALHPIHTESVAWIAAVTDLQLTFFYLLTFLCFLKLATGNGGRSPLLLLGMAGSYVLTLVSKDQAFTLPALATVYEHFYRSDRRETTPLQKAGRYYILWMLAMAYLLFRLRFFGALAPVLQISSLSIKEVVLSAVALVGQYMWKLLWPVNLCAFYVFRRSSSVSDPRVLAGLLSLVVMATLMAILWRRARPASFGLVWMMVTLAPVLNPRWMAANVYTERYLYLPSVGFCLLVASGVAYLWTTRAARIPKWRYILSSLILVVAALYAVRIVTRTRDWADDVTLYSRTLKVSPTAYHIRNNLGTVYWKQGRVEEATREWEEALRLSPRNAIILNNLGLVRAKQKRYEEAVSLFARAMRSKPNYTDPHLNLGTTFLDMARKPEAELQLRAAVALSPLNVEARNKLGKLWLEAGRLEDSEQQFLNSAASQSNWGAYYGLGEISRRRGDSRSAEGFFRRALELNPVESVVHFALGDVLAWEGQRTEALREYRAGLTTDPNNAEALAAIKQLESPPVGLSKP